MSPTGYPPRIFPEADTLGDTEAQPVQSRAQSRHTHSNLRWRRPGSDPQQPNGDDTRPKYAPEHGDASATYWKLHGLEAEMYDKNFVKGLKGSTNSMVILNTLFSAIIAAFIIEIYKTLLPTNSQSTVSVPQSSAIRINIVLFLSFLLSISSAVACALIQQGCDEYLEFAYPRTAPHKRGRVRTYLFQGLNVFLMRRFMYGTNTLLHISVILFFWAIGQFFYFVNHQFGHAILYALSVSVAIYGFLSISPLFISNSPYNTPMTPLLRLAFIIPLIIFRLPLWCLQWIHGRPFDPTGLRYYKGIHFVRARLYAIEAGKQAKGLEPYAMEWLFKENDFSDSDMDEFLKSLPGYMSSEHTKKDLLDQYLTADYVLTRIKGHFITCATSMELSDQASHARVSSCVKALVLIFQYSLWRKREHGSSKPGEVEEEIESQRMHIKGLIGDFQTLCDMDDHTTSLRASCISALAVQGLLSQLVPPPNSETTESSQFPALLDPIYDYLFSNNNTVTVPQPGRPGNRPTPRTMESLLRDGPLANLTRLAQAIRKREHDPPSTLSFCWKTLDILLTQLGNIHFDEPTYAQSAFDKLHEDIRKYVHGEEMGFRMTPLLEILDTVPRGRRLLKVFSSRPKYYGRATLVFKKEYILNSDLLEAFAHCLPDFIAHNSHDVCMDLMEKVVCRDDLWSKLQIILWTITQRSTGSTSHKFRVFEWCCNVLDVAFSVLEDSQKVDWRAPEFGSLWQHFESFITNGFQDAFLGRATSFRINIIKARFCKALLAQFSDDTIRRKVLYFQSRWDIASLAKQISYLGLRDDDDPKFWDAYVDGGNIGTKIPAKVLKMIERIAGDGPLLVFCQLGHLATSTIPSHHSGLEHKDIEKVLGLLDKLMAARRWPLNRASDAWKDLDQLREQVNDLCGPTSGGTDDTGNAGNTDEEGELLQLLLRKIDDVRNLRPNHSGHTEERHSSVSKISEGENDFEV